MTYIVIRDENAYVTESEDKAIRKAQELVQRAAFSYNGFDKIEVWDDGKLLGAVESKKLRYENAFSMRNRLKKELEEICSRS